MTTWDRARAGRTLRETLSRIKEAWADGGIWNGERFQQFDKLLAKAFKKRDLERVELLCQRYEAATMKDTAAIVQGSLWE